MSSADGTTTEGTDDEATEAVAAPAEPAASPEPSAPTEPTEPEPTDELRLSLLAAVTESLGDAVLGSRIIDADELTIRVATGAWAEAARIARHKLRCEYFCFLNGIDWMASPFGRYEDSPLDEPRAAPSAELATGVGGGDTRFQVFARVTDVVRHVGVTFKADVPDDDLAIDTWTLSYAGANWHERETHEMLGIHFKGHPNLVKLYLPGDFEGHPLRKDFPLLARQVKPWPGIVDVEPMPGEAGVDTADAAAAPEEVAP